MSSSIDNFEGGQTVFGEKELTQFNEALNAGTRGMWVCTQDGETFSVYANDSKVATGMHLNDAYLIDVMHGNFKALLRDLLLSKETITKMTIELSDLIIHKEAMEKAATSWREAYQNAKRDCELLQAEIDRLTAPENFHCDVG